MPAQAQPTTATSYTVIVVVAVVVTVVVMGDGASGVVLSAAGRKGNTRDGNAGEVMRPPCSIHTQPQSHTPTRRPPVPTPPSACPQRA